MRSSLLILALASFGCASAAAPFPTATSASLTGSLCGIPASPCRCAEGGEDLGQVPAGKKRYEFRFSQVSESEAGARIVGVGELLRPSGEQGDRCFYVDLAAGQTYSVTVHGQAHRRERGLALGYRIREFNPTARAFYTIIDQACGDGTAACPHDDPSDWITDYQNGHGRWDPCSSTRVEGYRAEGGFYDRHPTDAQITFALKVYRFDPRRAPGEEGCGGR